MKHKITELWDRIKFWCRLPYHPKFNPTGSTLSRHEEQLMQWAHLQLATSELVRQVGHMMLAAKPFNKSKNNQFPEYRVPRKELQDVFQAQRNARDVLLDIRKGSK